MPRSNVTIEARKRAGLCVACAMPVDGIYQKCEKCRQYNTRYLRERRIYCIDHHICTKCGAASAVGGNQLCEACRIKNAKYNHRGYQRRAEQ